MADQRVRRARLFARFQDSQRKSGLAGTAETLICPLCWHEKAENDFTLEHIVPGAIGGTRTTITCCSCNNTHGKDLDIHLVKYQQVADALNGLGGIPGRMTVNGQDVAVNVTARSDPKQVSIHIVSKASREAYVAGIKNDCKAGAAEKFNLRLNLGYNKNRMQTALLRVGYLALFHRFGYEYIREDLLQAIRLRILDPSLESFRLPSFVAGITDWNFPFDRPYFVLGRELNSMPYFQVMVRSRMKTTNYHGIVLPGFGLSKSQFFQDFAAYATENRRLTINGISANDLLDIEAVSGR